MAFADTVLNQSRATSVSGITLPRRECYFASPGDWRDEVLYFLLPDRFSDDEADRPMLDRGNLTAARPAFPTGSPGVGTAGRSPVRSASRVVRCAGSPRASTTSTTWG